MRANNPTATAAATTAFHRLTLNLTKPTFQSKLTATPRIPEDVRTKIDYGREPVCHEALAAFGERGQQRRHD
jgi:hypothetical protein